MLVDVPSATTYTINSSNILLNEKNQDRENFCKYLETYASNVVDRNTETYITWLEPQSDDIALNADTCKLFLPSPIESVVEFGVHQLADITLTITGISNYYDNPSSTFNSTMTYQVASLLTCMIDGEPVSMLDYVYNNYIRDYFPNCTKAQFYSGSDCASVGSYDSGTDSIKPPAHPSGFSIRSQQDSASFNPTAFMAPVHTSVATEFNSGEHTYRIIKPRSPSI